MCQKSLDKLTFDTYIIKQKEKERFNSTLIKWTVIIIIAGLCMVIANSNSDRDNRWKQLSDEEKEWYERNYGDGQYEEINEAIDDYIDSLN